MATIAVYTNFGGHIVKENRSGTKRGYVSDPLGSTVALVDSTGASTDTWEYWPYGEVESHTGSSTTPFTFVGTLGYFRDLVSKLTYVRARFYQALLGQWMTMDPFWRLGTAYQYAGSRPVQYTDRLGLLPPAVLACLVSGGITTIVNLFGGDDLPTALCKGALSCLIAALVALILPIVGAFVGCIVGGLAALIGAMGSRLCSGNHPCKNYSDHELACAVIAGLIDFIIGCITAGGDDGDADDEIMGGFAGFIISMVGTDCALGLDAFDPNTVRAV